MAAAADLRLSELLASKLCHDLVGPVGAVNNGMELLAEDDLLMGDEAVKLVNSSAQHAGTVLQFYRLAYGASGGGVTDYGMVRDLVEKMLQHQKSVLVWPENLPAMLPASLPKLILNLSQLGAESLPRGGKVVLAIVGAGAGADLTVTAQGIDARLRPESEIGLDEHAEIDDLTPRNVHAYFTQQLIRLSGSQLSVATDTPGEVSFSATIVE
ncbi:histidine phosphotransferase family protein [Algihabitans albus]|uniref:histidine phosphotransferase family protein n=1 Tax=Algihabitans albus TaxID=2164067 RepID=UPI000E5D95DF|nr:histidine phosphotransferase family protein [Algihabitans albus]